MGTETWVKVGASTKTESAEALNEALHALEIPAPAKLVVALVAPHFDMATIAEGLYEALHGTQVIGCTTSGEISTDGAMANALVLWALGGDAIRVATGYGQGDDLGLRNAATKAAQCLD